MNYFYMTGDANIFWESNVCMRVRKGVWNYTDAVLSIQNEPDEIKAVYRAISEEFIANRSCDVDKIIAEKGIEGEAKVTILGNFHSLVQQNFLTTADQTPLAKSLVDLLGFSFEGLDAVNYVQPALFLAEEGCSKNIATFLSKEIGYPLDMADQAFMRDLADADLVSKSEAMEHLKAMEKFEKVLEPYSVILGCFMRPPVVMLRNLNRILVKQKKPLILGLIDGPFLSIISVVSPETGCFECYEHRVMARLEDVTAYTSFVKNATQLGSGRAEDEKSYSPLISLLISVVLSEGFLTSSVKVNKTSGRVINIYLPTLEIQVQDLLRVPYCPACGTVAVADMDELFTSGRAIIDGMLEKIQVVKSN